MLKTGSALLLVLILAACDAGVSPPGPDFSLTVRVLDENGRPAADNSLYVRYQNEFTSTDILQLPTLPSGSSVSIPQPTPWVQYVNFTVDLRREVPFARVEVFDVTGVLRDTLDVPTLPGQHDLFLSDLRYGDNPLRGGVYRIKTTLGTEVVDQWILKTDYYPLSSTWYRYLGRTDADGTLRVSDPTIAPGLYDIPNVPIFDENGAAIGMARVPRTAEILAIPTNPEDTRPLSRGPVTFDGRPLTVTIRPAP